MQSLSSLQCEAGTWWRMSRCSALFWLNGRWFLCGMKISWKYLRCIFENPLMHAFTWFTTHSWKKLWDRSSRARNYTLWLLTLLTHALLRVSVSSLSLGTGINANPEATESPRWIWDSCCRPTRPPGSNGDLAAACSWSPVTAAPPSASCQMWGDTSVCSWATCEVLFLQEVTLRARSLSYKGTKPSQITTWVALRSGTKV